MFCTLPAPPSPIGVCRSSSAAEKFGGNPALVYNSDTVAVRPIIELKLDTDDNFGPPDLIEVTLAWDGRLPQQTVSFLARNCAGSGQQGVQNLQRTGVPAFGWGAALDARASGAAQVLQLSRRG